MYYVAAFYHFIDLDDVPGICAQLKAAGQEIDACGIILVAPEGINATIAGPDEASMHAYVAQIAKDFSVPDHVIKWSTAESKPFGKFKVRAKKETITMNRPIARVVERTGTHVSPAEWNDIIGRDDVLLIDTRNDYETALGTFEGAVDPVVKTFTQFADYVDNQMDPQKTPKIAMFCTGGIRCEKASSYMLARGFQEVYQLNGGILRYLETMPKDQSKWRGDCFVFDERVALGHGLNETAYEWCEACHAFAKPKGQTCTCADAQQKAEKSA